jgi:RNA polymerase sigma factor (sigma-70 family)
MAGQRSSDKPTKRRSDEGAGARSDRGSTHYGGSAVTQLLSLAGAGDQSARDELWRAVYAELKLMAASQLASEASGHTFHPTMLVHESFLRLVGPDGEGYVNRRHFFAAAANAMRRICIDDARKRKSQKRGGRRPLSLTFEPGEMERLSLPHPVTSRCGLSRGSVGISNSAEGCLDDDPDVLLAVDQALERLREIDPVRVAIVEHRFFVGMTIDETAAAMGVSPRTVDTHWRFARAWLHRELQGLRD